MHLDPLITDLAYILALAGVVTVLFKLMKQPVVLGYIVVGILVGSDVSFLPNVTNEANVKNWAEIGIIFLLFALGLEFSFKKLIDVGRSAVITALSILFGMMLTGFTIGHLLEWSRIDSLFLGAMLSMSSTTIILKAFNDMGLRRHKFTHLVFGILIVEDLFAIILMVLFSYFSTGSEFDGMALGANIVKLVFVLSGWFLVGIYVIPSLLRLFRAHLSAETLLVISLGLCLGLVVMANKVGFSSALGAFVMGSLLAETSEGVRIEKLIQPIKDLFGAIFFVSVGLLVKFDILIEYALPIGLIVVAVVFGQIIFSVIGMLVSGQSVKTSLQAGFSLVQIGEFAFIIASLGQSLNVTSKFLYPIAVAVSVITTFITPFIMKLSLPAINIIERRLPNRVKRHLDQAQEDQLTAGSHNAERNFIRKNLLDIVMYSTILGGIIWFSHLFLYPFVDRYFSQRTSSILSLCVGLSVMMPFLWALLFRHFYSSDKKSAWTKDSNLYGISVSFLFLRVLLALFLISMQFISLYSFGKGILLFGLVAIGVLILAFQSLKKRYLKMEQSFMRNLSDKNSLDTKKLQSSNFHLVTLHVSPDSSLIGNFLYKAEFRQTFGIHIVSIERGSSRINIPGRQDQLFPYDKISVVGTEEQLYKFAELVELRDSPHPPENNKAVKLKQVKLSPASELVNKSIINSGLRDKYGCLIVSIIRENGEEITPLADTLFMAYDHVWLVGDEQRLQALSYVLRPEPSF